MDTFEVDVVVAGAGVVGIAIARALAMSGREVWLLERGPRFGEETSARNSEVIHAGIYYDPGSIKARLCRRGRDLLYDFCAQHNVPHARCGKLIVATNEDEAAKLPSIAARALENGVEDLVPIDGKMARRMEPSLGKVTAALHSPSTGIIDSHSYMLAMLTEAEAHGAQLQLQAPVEGGRIEEGGRILLNIGGAEPVRLSARSFINAAGLWAASLTDRIEGFPPSPDMAYVKGNYFTLSRSAPFKRLIYPVPREGGLGVHLTLDLGGQAKFGPDTEWGGSNDPNSLDYRVDPARRAAFAEAIRHYWPDIQEEDLAPGYAGVRPKLAGGLYPDFRIDGPATHGAGSHVLHYGIESPGLTSALAIAEETVNLLN
ncbi:NAD(P)/FAD-dependent oxidoreductase [Maritimibacter dapengensis]|uniref:NAD(P)/FAD-dependent oxidoreductase n=1 Tax=Maritimibacter dapengensis TaxID=2836868 RepID=A0ABS6T5J3_9RHOB|nr:NAD(P)/FAD-dependent oxidoreductase [Maritimibacter dapengensis]MBV7379801.1 NAD(P)/FAD-dependent oxidoreductase [Maritimibacter dapengensis]